MGRWTQYDEDSYRLPEGMKRVGYDADTQKYSYRDRDGSLWEGPEGASYGELTQVEGAPRVLTGEEREEGEDIEAGSAVNGYHRLPTDSVQIRTSRNSEAYRTILPFFLLICIVLLLVFRLTRPFSRPDAGVRLCPEDTQPYTVVKGDTCWEICQRQKCEVKLLKDINPDMICESLRIGETICLPEKKKSSRRRV
ncbi:carbohydrate-binding module family 50 protein [Jaapia argillacea MUCL 33604]|uniref:Carbohydrate-binding module family 50 protein n=1 Tax=Jaapia argillacea MUCL 33604 TaxID=933084 RepID=A0A067Q9L6_9AGAM|nr:carbohydrate-binding module family 50 protein [Jaapia argillacea MUCL 33604]